MAEFYIKPVKVNSYSSQIRDMGQKLDGYAVDIMLIRNDLKHCFSGDGTVSSHLKTVGDQLRKEEFGAFSLHKEIERILLQYSTSEKLILSLVNPNMSSSHGQNGKGYHVNSIVFDDIGGYGGDQGHMKQVYYWDPIKCWELLGYLWEYFPGMSIFEAFGYFSRLNSVGCGYVAMANTIFMEYADRPEEFERIFGFPMYKDGDLNYDRLILDIYATTDIAGFNDREDGLPRGTVAESRAKILEYYLSDKGVGVNSKVNVKVTPENFSSISENGGHVIMGYWYGNMYDESGKPHYIDGGHAITVTGVTEDGRYIVSSWGEKYYINASDINADDSFMVIYYNS